jgi:hypothetical protein
MAGHVKFAAPTLGGELPSDAGRELVRRAREIIAEMGV